MSVGDLDTVEKAIPLVRQAYAASCEQPCPGKITCPVLDVEAEAARLHQLGLDTAYENFFAHEATAHAVRQDWPATSTMQVSARMGAERRAEERMAPEIDRKWAELVRAGTWAEWLDRSDEEPVFFSVWTLKDLTHPT